MKVAGSLVKHEVGIREDANRAALLLSRLEKGHTLLASLPKTSEEYGRGRETWSRLCAELYETLRSAYAHFYLLRKVNFAVGTDLWAAVMPPLPAFLPLAKLVAYIGGRTDPPHWITEEEHRLFRGAAWMAPRDVFDLGVEETFDDCPF